MFMYVCKESICSNRYHSPNGTWFVIRCCCFWWVKKSSKMKKKYANWNNIVLDMKSNSQPCKGSNRAIKVDFVLLCAATNNQSSGNFDQIIPWIIIHFTMCLHWNDSTTCARWTQICSFHEWIAAKLPLFKWNANIINEYFIVW